MAGTSLLAIDDPLLPRVREAALHHPTALSWLLDSARAWARREFVRRDQEREAGTRSALVTGEEYMDERMHELELHQVAVLTGSTYTEETGIGRTRDRIYVGFLCEGANASYLKLSTTRGTDSDLAGMFRVLDIFELPPEWRLSQWPTDQPRVIDYTPPSIIDELNDKHVVIDPDVMREVDSMGPAFQEMMADAMRRQYNSSPLVFRPDANSGLAMAYKGIPIMTVDSMTPDTIIASTPVPFKCPDCGQTTINMMLNGVKPVVSCMHCQGTQP